MEEIEQILNEASGNMGLQEYRELLEEVLSTTQSRLDALDEDEEV